MVAEEDEEVVEPLAVVVVEEDEVAVVDVELTVSLELKINLSMLVSKLSSNCTFISFIYKLGLEMTISSTYVDVVEVVSVINLFVPVTTLLAKLVIKLFVTVYKFCYYTYKEVDVVEEEVVVEEFVVVLDDEEIVVVSNTSIILEIAPIILSYVVVEVAVVVVCTNLVIAVAACC